MATKKLKFDVEALSKMQEKVNTTRDDLSSSKDKVLTNFSELKEDWKTDAGKKALENLNDNWVTDVDKYIKTLDVLSELLGEAITHYSTVEEAVESLTF